MPSCGWACEHAGRTLQQAQPWASSPLAALGNLGLNRLFSPTFGHAIYATSIQRVVNILCLSSAYFPCECFATHICFDLHVSSRVHFTRQREIPKRTHPKFCWKTPGKKSGWGSLFATRVCACKLQCVVWWWGKLPHCNNTQ